MGKFVSVVFTGGGCAGKTTILEHAKQVAIDRGWFPYILCEPAAIAFDEGALLLEAIVSKQWDKVVQYEMEIARISIAATERAKHFARIEGHNAVAIFDRAVPDNRVYFPIGEEGDELYKKMLIGLSIFRGEALFPYYNVVIKMTTAARGRQTFYNLDNPHRSERPIEAIRHDHAIERAYREHPRLRIIRNLHDDFEGKIERAIQVFREELDRA